MVSGRPRKLPEPRVREAFSAVFGRADEVGEGAALGEQERESAHDVERAERCDEGRDTELGDQYSVDSADQDAERERNSDDLGNVEIERVGEAEKIEIDAVENQSPGDHPAQTDDRADREIDAASDDDEGHADRQECVQRDVLRHQDQVRRRHEVRCCQREEDQHGQERDEGAEPH